ncbi:MAG: phosphoglucosamine mutase [Planctomycetes bacterium]|nr:phosphoglucosamine mutase [Planctomycetota bacterium]
MTRPRHFGTDGLRGVANTGMLAPEQVLALGRAIGRLASREGGLRVALARDPRRSSPLLAAAVAAGIAAEGVDVLDLGVLPTPALAALLPASGAMLGVVVSASHNPMQDNGIKVLGQDGAKLADSLEAWLEEETARPLPAQPPVGAAVGDVRVLERPVERYVEHVASLFPGLDLRGLKIVVDCANGATSTAAPALLGRLGAEVAALCAEPDGLNINDQCGAVHPERMARAVRERSADAGVALDGDGDRAIFASSDGSIQDGDRVLFACGRRLFEQGRLRDGVVVGTVMTNFGLELALAQLGARLVRTPVGDRHVAAALRENGWCLGGEPSGHIIFGGENNFIGDGLVSALKVFALMRQSGAPLHALTAALQPVPQVLLNVAVEQKPPLESLPAVMERIAAAERELAGSGRVLVRYSGTENLLRVMVEGRDGALVERSAASIAQAVRERIGAGGVPPS